MAGLYIHIPFCKQACHYCDFHFSTNLSKQTEMVSAIAKELKLQKAYLESETIDTIYFGGGTPSLLSGRELFELWESIRLNYPLNPAAEITLEANPDDLSVKKLNDFKLAGINRLSIGIQSFDEAILKFLNRVHSAESSHQCFYDARAAGFQNISIDIIYAIPGLDISLWKESIASAAQLYPEHISAYTLTIEPDTVFGRLYAKRKFPEVSDDDAATQMEILISLLEQAGYEQYEVSNFSRPGYRSQHNSSYWSQKKYLGVGPGAHSFNGINRQQNISNNHHYLRALTRDEIPCEIEVLTIPNKINEYLLTSLRTEQGCDIKRLKTMYGFDLLARYEDYIQGLLQKKLAVLKDGKLKLTKPGKLLADKIASDFFLDS